ncbi:MAG: response regulator [Pseudomonas sp.]|uniref:response regulator transcription factor n=1 Tax=Pseudomonas sp. TaxID=306 RepID=UPI0027341361|nr:response regulator [Pseudomonas sp.]MDP3847721.1 response regulator [Pseudomonas sp.]
MNKIVLIVDDSQVSRMMFSNLILTEDPSWQIFEAANGVEALSMAQQCQPSLITLDINMPLMDGFEAAALLRAQFPAATLVLISANIQASSRTRAEALGVHFLAKPISALIARQTIALWDSEHV